VRYASRIFGLLLFEAITFMFRIGDFSRVARVSCRLLRYYDEIGLLKPAAESESGYRYYTAAQLGRLNRILVLKDLGFSLDEITRIVSGNLRADELRGMLMMRRREVERSIETEMERLKHIESRIAQIETEGQLSAEDVVLRDEPSRLILSLRQTVASFLEGRQLIGAITQTIKRSVPREKLGTLIGVVHSPEFEADQIDVEIGYSLTSALNARVALTDGRELIERELSAVRVAACVRIGLPEHAHLITGKIAQFVEANGYQLAGPSREVFLQQPNPQRMEESIVEMQYPIASQS
jgi:DNA-binding transcriptional MerR regulator